MGFYMNFSKLFLVFSLFSLVVHTPMQAAGIAYKPAALMAAASTAGAVLANGVIAIAESIKKEKLFEMSCQIAQLENDSLQRQMPKLVPNQVNLPSPFELIAFCAAVVGAVYLLDLYDEETKFGPQPITDKEQSTISNI